MSSASSQKLMNEIRRLMRKPLDDFELFIKNDANLNIINAYMTGPNGSPYENGQFEIELRFGSDYPRKPPKGYFRTKIFHPNIAQPSGEICVNTLKRDWKPEYGIKHIFMAIRSLLLDPNYDSALNEEAGKLLMSSYEDFAKKARMMTNIYSIPIQKSKQLSPSKIKKKSSKHECKRNDDDRYTQKENVGMKTKEKTKKEVMDEYLNENKNNANANKEKEKDVKKHKGRKHKKSKNKNMKKFGRRL